MRSSAPQAGTSLRACVWLVYRRANVRSGSTTDLTALRPDFRFTPESRLRADIAPCPVRADFVAEIGRAIPHLFRIGHRFVLYGDMWTAELRGDMTEAATIRRI